MGEMANFFLALILSGVAGSGLMLPLQGPFWIFKSLPISAIDGAPGGLAVAVVTWSVMSSTEPQPSNLFRAAQIESPHESGAAAGNAGSVPDSLTATPAWASAGSSHEGHVR